MLIFVWNLEWNAPLCLPRRCTPCPSSSASLQTHSCFCCRSESIDLKLATTSWELFLAMIWDAHLNQHLGNMLSMCLRHCLAAWAGSSCRCLCNSAGGLSLCNCTGLHCRQLALVQMCKCACGTILSNCIIAAGLAGCQSNHRFDLNSTHGASNF